MTWAVLFLPSAVLERQALAARERVALDNVMAKLQALGPQLRHPHSSAVLGFRGLRELRP